MNPQKQSFNTIRIIHIALLTGVCLFLGFSYITTSSRPFQPNEMLTNVGMIISILSIALAFFIPTLLSKSKNNNNLGQLNKYQSIKIVQWALLEGPALLNSAIFFITGNLISCYIALAITIVLASRYPSENEMNQLVPNLEPEKTNTDDRF